MKLNVFDSYEFLPSNVCSIAVAIIGAGVVGAATTAYTSHQASRAQTEATNRASQIAQNQYQQTREDFSPYREAGTRAIGELERRLPFLTSPITMDQQTLEQTPGYQFTREQGLKAVQNSAAARGLGVSGAALKGAATFATGLADSTYKTQFDVENTNRTNAYTRLMGLVGAGSGAATATGAAGTAAANTSAGAAIGAGNAQAAAWNTTGNAVSNVARDVSGYMAYRGLYGNSRPTP